jgi:hypothetical protein
MRSSRRIIATTNPSLAINSALEQRLGTIFLVSWLSVALSLADVMTD